MNLDERPRDDLIPFMVYSRNCQDQEYAGMYCVVLKHNDKVVSAALVRIFGRQLAEVPLVATSSKDQGQGKCKALMLSIERLLGVLHVKHLVLSAAEGAEDIWLTKFGFNQISNLQVCCAFYHILIDGFLHG
jgi:N-acetylglutamate synthase-like GNAT family acetyltransferase